MAVRSGFWNSSGSDIRRYYNSDFSHLISLLINDGVSQNYGESLIPTTGNGMTVVIQTGEAWFNDIWLRNDTDLVVDIDAAPIVSGYSRLDAIAIKIDASSGVRDGTIVYMAGTPTAGTPTLPEMVDTLDVHWHLLASVLVKTNDTSIPRERITNYVGSTTTPLITGLLETVSTEDLIQQWQAEFNSWNSSKQAEFEAWVETIRGILDEETAGHLQLEIEDLYSKTHTNLLNPTLPTKTENGITIMNNGDGTYTLTGTATADTFFDNDDGSEFITFPAGKYHYSGTPIGGSNSTYKSGLFIDTEHQNNDFGNGVDITFDGTQRCVLRIVVYKNTTLPSGGLTFKPMLTTDLSVTYDDYVPYSGSGELNENVASLYNGASKTNASLATIESGTTASKAYGDGDLLVYQGRLCITKNTIAKGATLTIGDNIEYETLQGVVDQINANVNALNNIKLNKTGTAANSTKWADWIADIMTENQNVTWVLAVGPDAKIQHRWIPLAYNTDAPTLTGLTVNGDSWYNNGQVTVNRTDNWYNWHFLAMRGDKRLFHTQYDDYNAGYNLNSKYGYELVCETGDMIFSAHETGLFHFNGSGRYSGSWAASSSRRYKDNIESISDDTAKKLLELRPVEFDYKEFGNHSHGFIAEEVSEILPDMVVYDTEGKPDAIDYTQFIAHLIKLCQIQQNQIDELKRKVVELEEKCIEHKVE